MTVCPIAIVAGCSKCPVVKICPLKTILGDAPKAAAAAAPPAAPKTAAKKKPAARAAAKKPAARAK